MVDRRPFMSYDIPYDMYSPFTRYDQQSFLPFILRAVLHSVLRYILRSNTTWIIAIDMPYLQLSFF